MPSGHPVFLLFIGGEFLPAVACFVAACWAVSAERWTVAGLCLALAVSFRAELALAALCLAAVIALSGKPDRWRQLARIGSVALALWSVWLVALYRICGELIPSTLAAKQAQGASVLGIWPSGWGLVKNLASLSPRALFFRLDGLTIALAVVLPLAGLVFFLTRSRLRRSLASALLAWGALHIALLALLGVGAYTWYGIPLWLALAVAIGMNFELLRGVDSRYRWISAVAVALVLGIAIAGYGDSQGWQLRPGPDERRAAYTAVASYLDTYPPGTRLAAWEVGYLGYFAKNPVVDLLGLVTPDVPLEEVRTGNLAAIRDQLDAELLMVLRGGGPLTAAVLNSEKQAEAALSPSWASRAFVAGIEIYEKGSDF